MISGMNIMTLLCTVSRLHHTLENFIYEFAAFKIKTQAISFIMMFIAIHVSSYS
jgi:fumarate reductase subunit D